MTQADKNSQNETKSLTAQEALFQHFKVLAEYKTSEKEKENGGIQNVCGVR